MARLCVQTYDAAAHFEGPILCVVASPLTANMASSGSWWASSGWYTEDAAGGFAPDEAAAGSWAPDETASSSWYAEDAAGGFAPDEAAAGGWAPDETAASESSRVAPGRHPPRVWRRPKRAMWAHLFFSQCHPDFRLVRRVIGQGGSNLKRIFYATDVKLRVRGFGSGHLEGLSRKEAPVPLMLALSGLEAEPAAFKNAVRMAVDVLNKTSAEYTEFLDDNGFLHVGRLPLFCFGEISTNSASVIKEFVDVHPPLSLPSKKVPATGMNPEVRRDFSAAPRRPTAWREQAWASAFVECPLQPLTAVKAWPAAWPGMIYDHFPDGTYDQQGSPSYFASGPSVSFADSRAESAEIWQPGQEQVSQILEPAASPRLNSEPCSSVDLSRPDGPYICSEDRELCNFLEDAIAEFTRETREGKYF